MKKIFALLLIIVMCFLCACGTKADNPESTIEKEVVNQEDNKETESKTTEVEQVSESEVEKEVVNQEDNKETESKTTEVEQVSESEVEKYPNVEGYPIEKNGIKECKLFFNGVVYEYVNGYTRDDYPDVLYVTVDPILYQSYQLTSGVITSSKVGTEELQLKCGHINGKMYLVAVGKPFLNIDGVIYEDLEPQLVEFQEGWEDFCCTTLFLEKTAGARIHISEDRSAAYIEVDTPISNADNDKYEYKTEPGGKIIATNKTIGEQMTLEVPAEYLPAQSSDNSSASGQGNGSNNSGSTYKAPKTCTSCGGSGKVTRNVQQRDPVSGVITYTYQMENCSACGGTGHTN